VYKYYVYSASGSLYFINYHVKTIDNKSHWRDCCAQPAAFSTADTHHALLRCYYALDQVCAGTSTLEHRAIVSSRCMMRELLLLVTLLLSTIARTQCFSLSRSHAVRQSSRGSEESRCTACFYLVRRKPPVLPAVAVVPGA
jgi:hypothetical protein